MKFNNKRTLSLLLAMLLLVVSFAGCKSRDSEEKPGEKPEKVEIEVIDGTVSKIMPDFTDQVKEKEEQNEDTVGWLQVPYTTISEVVVQGEDNAYYLRRNFEKVDKQIAGIFFADSRNDFGNGTREDLPVNTVVYGHALTDDEEKETYDVKFGPLHDFRDENFAKENPYIFFSTDTENFAYEVISVFVANSDNPENPYNKGDAVKGDFHKLVKEEILPRSKWDYGVEINDDDKFLTLSTCIYYLDDGTATNYPKTFYRYAILARLVDNDAELKETVDIKVNEDVIIDPDGKIGSK